jgi:branched-chain amino acid transport system substrate-binding protein
MWQTTRRGRCSAVGRRLAGLGAAALVAAACGGASSAGQGGGPVVVCQEVALSGPFVTLGQYDAYGVEAFFQQLNKHGGLLGRQVRLVTENDQSSPPAAASLARKCVTEDHANFILGPEETSSSAAAVPVQDALQTVSIGMQSGWNMQGLTQQQLHSFAFPGFYNVFLQDDLDTVQRLIKPRHYTRVAVIEDNTSGGLPNQGYMVAQASKNGFQVVSTQIVQPGATNDTPQVLDMLNAKPDIIVLGLTPGPDTSTAIRAIRAQNPTIPISECSQCWLPSFIAAVGGPSVMQNVYILGNVEQLASSLPDTPANRATIQDVNNYVEAMKSAGFSAPDQISSGTIGWAVGSELVQAVKAAGSVSETKVRDALRHQRMNTVGISWDRTPSDYANITNVEDVTMIVAPNGAQQVFAAGAVG